MSFVHAKSAAGEAISKMKQQSKSFVVEVKRSRRKQQHERTPPAARGTTAAASPLIAEIGPVEAPRGRILPSLEQPELIHRASPAEPTATIQPQSTRKLARGNAKQNMAAAQSSVLPTSPVNQFQRVPVIIKPFATTKRSTAKLSREAFLPGNRWKHRLSSAAHQAMQRRHQIRRNLVERNP